MSTVYTMTRVLISDDGSVEDFSTDIYLSEEAVRRAASEDFRLDQLVIGETQYRAAESWYDDLYLAEDSGDDIDLHLRVDMHMLPK